MSGNSHRGILSVCHAEGGELFAPDAGADRRDLSGVHLRRQNRVETLAESQGSGSEGKTVPFDSDLQNHGGHRGTKPVSYTHLGNDGKT